GSQSRIWRSRSPLSSAPGASSSRRWRSNRPRCPLRRRRVYACGVEGGKLGSGVAEDRPGDEIAAGEPEHVAVSAVGARDPEAGRAWEPAHEREVVERLAPDSGPPVRHDGSPAHELRGIRRQLVLNDPGRFFLGGALGVEIDVSAAAEDQTAVAGLLPVVEAVAGGGAGGREASGGRR